MIVPYLIIWGNYWILVFFITAALFYFPTLNTLWRREGLPTLVLWSEEFRQNSVQSMGLQRVIHDWVNFTFTQNTRFPICSHSHLCIYSQNNWNQDLKEINSSLVFHQEMIGSVQFISVTQSCLTLCNPVNPSMPGLPVHHQLPEFTRTHAHRVGDAIQPSHPLLSLSPPAPNSSQHQGLFQWVNSSHEVAKVLEFQLQHQSFQWIPRTDL